MFLDEPAAAMDVGSRRSFWRMIRQFGHEGRTNAFATHHLQEADEVADCVVVINRGKAVANGPGATLQAAVARRRARRARRNRLGPADGSVVRASPCA